MTKVLFASVFILLASTFNYLKANDDSVECDTLTVKSGCLCPGNSIVYQCAVNDSVQGLTVWQASGCNQEVSLLNDDNFVNTSGPTACLNVHGVGVSINDDCYVSELTINNISASNNIGGNVTCSLDVGSVITVDYRTISIPSSDSLSLNPLHQRDSRRGELSFTWEPLIIMDCPSLRYNITASEGCGACPNSVLDNGITCTNVQRGKSCTLSVFVNLCSDLIRSDPITVSTGSLPMIRNLRSRDGSSEPVMLIWDLVNASYCSSIDYVVNATEGCGSCSLSQERNAATCRGVGKGIVCTFSIFANVCGDHIQSETILITPPSTEPVPPNTEPVPLGGTSRSAGIIIGIILGVFVAVAVGAVIVVGVVVWMCRRHRRGQGKNHELQVGLQDINSHKNEDERKGQATDNGERTGRPSSQKMFGRFVKEPSHIAIGDGLKKAQTIGVATTVTVTFDNNEHVTGELIKLNGFERTPCIMIELEVNKRCVLKYTPTTRGQHKLHIKVHELGMPKHNIRTIDDISKPSKLVIDQQGEIFVAEEGNQCVSIIRLNGKKEIFGSPTDISLPGSHILKRPHDIAVCDDGTVLVTDTDNHHIVIFTSEQKFIKSVGKYGNRPLEFNEPMGIDIHPITKHIFVTDYKNHRIQILNPDLKFITCHGSEGSDTGRFNNPWDVSFDSEGNVYIADSGNHRIQVFEYRPKEKELKFLRVFGEKGRGKGQLSWPSSVCVDRTENLVYITEDNNHRVSVFTHMGEFQTLFGTKGESEGEFNLPHGVVIDKDGYVYVSDHYNNRLQVF